MILAVDGTVWGGPETGVASLTRRLIERFALSERREELLLFTPRRAGTHVAGLIGRPGTRVAWTPDVVGGTRVAWQQLVLPARARRAGSGLLYCPCYTVPQCCAVPAVVTIHDLIVWKRPDLCPAINVLHFRLLVGRSARKARVVTVPTEVVKRDVLNMLDVPENKVVVVPWGVDLIPQERREARRLVRERHRIDAPFALFVGGHDPKKNLSAARRAVQGSGLVLVIIGPTPRRRGARGPLLLLSSLREIDLGFVPSAVLPDLYAAAEVVVCPSFIEGFGAPALEAMACGTPVIVSDDPALVEICGGAAIHVPLDEPDALAGAVRRIVDDTAGRETIIQRGRSRAAQFTWNRSVEAFRKALDHALSA